MLVDDVGLPAAVQRLVAGMMVNSGQSCNAPTRLLVPHHLMDEAAAIAGATANSLTVGPPRSDVRLGPVVSLRQFNQIQGFIEQGMAEGAKLAAGALPLNPSLPPITLSVPAHRQRRGHQVRLMIAGEGKPIQSVLPTKPARDDKLIALLAEAHAARQLVLSNPEIPLAELARHQGKCRKSLALMIELSCLAPNIVSAIMAGQQPASLTTAKLRSSPLPLSWNEQRALLLRDQERGIKATA